MTLLSLQAAQNEGSPRVGSRAFAACRIFDTEKDLHFRIFDWTMSFETENSIFVVLLDTEKAVV